MEESQNRPRTNSISELWFTRGGNNFPAHRPIIHYIDKGINLGVIFTINFNVILWTAGSRHFACSFWIYTQHLLSSYSVLEVSCTVQGLVGTANLLEMCLSWVLMMLNFCQLNPPLHYTFSKGSFNIQCNTK